MWSEFIQWLTSGPMILQRLVFISLEIVLWVVILECVIRLKIVRSPRLIALLWVVVFLKCTWGLAIPGTVKIPVEPPRFETAVTTPFQIDATRDRGPAPPRPISTDVRVPVPINSEIEAVPSEPHEQRGEWKPVDVRYALLAAWFVGVVLFAGRLGIEIVRLTRISRSSGDADTVIKQLLREESDLLSLRWKPALKQNDMLGSPGLAGFFFPTLYIPTLLCPATENTLRWVIRHELTHWKHGDLYANTLRQIMLTLFFFHPLAWYASRRWLDYAEYAVDRAVLFETEDADDYATNLLGVAEMSKKLASNPLKLNAVFAWKHHLVRRIDRLLNLHVLLPRNPNRFGLGISLVAILIGIGFTIGTEIRPAVVMANETEQSPSNSLEVGGAVKIDGKWVTPQLPRKGDAQIEVRTLEDGSQVINEYKIPPARTLQFPEHVSMGEIRIGRETVAAQGTVVIKEGARARMRLSETGTFYLKIFETFPPYAFQELNLSRIPIQDDDLKYIRHMSGLNKLQLRSTPIGDDGLSHLSNLVHLRLLDLYSTWVTGAGLQHLSRMTNLQELILNRTQVGDDGFAAIRHLTELGRIECWMCPITDKALDNVAGWTNMRFFNVENTAVTDASLHNLLGMKKMYLLNLGLTNITDKGVEILRDMTQLTQVSIANTAVTEKSIDILKNWTKIKRMYLPITISPKGYEQLKHLPAYKSFFTPYVNSTPLKVIIEDYETGTRLPNAEFVYKLDHGNFYIIFVKTDSNGEATIYVPDYAEIAKFRVYVPGYVTYEHTWGEPAPGDSVVLGLKKGVSVGGYVMNSDGEKVLDASVTIPVLGPYNWDDEKNLMTTVFTDSSGYWWYDGVPVGLNNMSVTIQHPDYGDTLYQAERINREALTSKTAEFSLEPPVYLIGAVETVDGNPIENARISIQIPWRRGSVRTTHTGTSDADGTFTLFNPAKGSLMVSVVADGFRPYSKSVTIEETMEDLEVVLVPN